MLSLLIDIVSVSVAGHLLLHGPFSHDVWSFVFSTFGLHRMMPEKVIDVYTLVGKGWMIIKLEGVERFVIEV